MLDLLVLALLFVIVTGGKQTQFATPPRPPSMKNFGAAMQRSRKTESRLRAARPPAQLNTTRGKRTTPGRLSETSATLASGSNMKALAEEKARVERPRPEPNRREHGAANSPARPLSRTNSSRKATRPRGLSKGGWSGN